VTVKWVPSLLGDGDGCAGTIFVAPVYLHNLLDVARMPSHQAFDCSSFHQSILAVSETSRALHLEILCTGRCAALGHALNLEMCTKKIPCWATMSVHACCHMKDTLKQGCQC